MRSHGLLLVGYGRRGRQWDHEVSRRRGTHLVGVLEPDEDARADASGAGHTVWAGLADALAATTADGALIAAPAAAHRDLAERCLRAGLAVLVEKPLALSTADAVAVARVARETGRPALVGQNFRHRRWARAVESAIREGRIGRPHEVVITTVRPASAAPPSAAEDACGALWDLGIHHLDRYRRHLGGPPRDVVGRIESTADGSRCTVEATWADWTRLVYHQTDGAPGYAHQELVIGPHGMLRVTDQRVHLLSSRRRPRRLRGRRRPRPERLLLDRFAAALEGTDATDATVEENLPTVAFLEAACLAVRTGTTVAPDELLAQARTDDTATS